MRKFENQVKSGIYPELPGIKDIDFSLLTQNVILVPLEYHFYLNASQTLDFFM